MATRKTTTKTETAVETEVTVKPKATAATKKKYENEDMIPCRAIITGETFITGERSKFLYSWAGYGDVVEIEYRDLVYMIRSNHTAIYAPWIVIEDQELVKEYPNIQKIYDSMYSVGDFKEILNLNPARMKEQIEGLPNGAKESIKGLAATMIENGQLDSVSTVKALDEIFGTKLVLTLVEK